MPADRRRHLRRLDRRPFFNPAISTTLKTQIMGGIGFAVFELLAMRIIGYIPH